MYIPLDNLYEWISGVSRDILIYRFYPHGSRNLEDIQVVNDSYNKLPWIEQKHLVPAICYDQEPLNYDYYNISWQELRDLSSKSGLLNHIYPLIKDNKSAWELLSSRNIASMTTANLNDRTILIHSEKRSDELTKYENHGFVGSYWWAHAMIARDWYRFAQHDHRLNYPDEFQLDFNIYARAWQGTREYRLKLLELISDIHSHCRITFSERDICHYQEHSFKNADFQIASDLKLHNTTVSSSQSADYSPEHYNQCAVDVVLETLFDDSRLHLTEKILRPIACGKPFILASTYKSLEYLRSYGFKTFSGLIDEQYDLINDPTERLRAIAKSMSTLTNLDTRSKQKLWAQMKPICDHNRKLFFSEEFTNSIKQELWDNVQHAEQQIKQSHQTGNNFVQWKNSMEKPTYEQVIKIDKSKRDQLAKILKHYRSHQQHS